MQRQAFKTAQDQSLKSLLSQRTKDEQALAAPYTVFMKQLRAQKAQKGQKAQKAQKAQEADAPIMYSWVAYSIGRPRNIVWGIVLDGGDGLTVDYGCNWNNLGIINNMLEIRKKNGYVAVSTYAKDRITNRIISNLIVDAYHNGTGLLETSALDLQDAVLDQLAEQELEDTVENVEKVAQRVAKKLAYQSGPVNREQILRSDIPKHIVDAVHDFIGHAPILNGEIPVPCPTPEECDQGSAPDLTCDLYSRNYGLL